MDVEKEIAVYESERPRYESFCRKLNDLLDSLVRVEGIPFQVIEARVKDSASLRDKFQRPDKSYSRGLKDIDDLCGCRIIAYYADDCAKLAELIKREFRVVEEELSHQQDKLKDDQFGYLSAHYVVKLKRGRANLAEWSPFKDLRAEIQIRTVIQHAWSAVSHALQYKAETEVPSRLRRRLFRIAGLFELADEEFSAIRDQRNELRKSASEALAAGDKSIPLNVASIAEFLQQWPYRAVLREAAENAGFSTTDESDHEYIGQIYDGATRLGLSDIAGFQERLEKADLAVFSDIFSAQKELGAWFADVEFLTLLLLLSEEREAVTSELLVRQGWAPDIAKEVLAGLSKRPATKV